MPPGCGEGPVRAYTTFTSSVFSLRDWLLECGIKTAAMESGQLLDYDVLTRAGIEIYLVNVRHVKGLLGKKTDACRAQ